MSVEELQVEVQAALDWWDSEGQHIQAGMWQGLDTIVAAARLYATLLDLVAEQAADEGLWFVGVTAPEEYLMAALRRLHAQIEDDRETLAALTRGDTE